MGGMRVANGLAFIITLSFIGSIIGWISGHPALGVETVGPLLLVLVFENFWLFGRTQRPVYTRLVASASIVLLGSIIARIAILGGNGLHIVLVAVAAFATIIALGALVRPIIRPL